MVDNATLGYIIGGSVAGGVFIIAIVAIIAYCTCGTKRKKRRHEKKFHPLPESGRQSQHSTLSQIDPRGLPKVGSGLWVEAPAVYQAAPNQGLYYGRPNPKYRVEPGVQRSASELRLPGAPPGHAVYQGNVRIYHSQQLAPVYEVVDTSRAPGVISIYEYNDLTHSRSRLINRDSAERHHHRERDSKKVKRSNSDLNHSRTRDKRESSKRHSDQSRHSTNERQRSDRHRQESPNHVKSSQKSKSLDSLKAASYDNQAFEVQTASVNVHNATEQQHPATDSMKLQDRQETRPLFNKTDDEKQEPPPKEPEIQTKHYVYEGSVYALPSKPGTKSSRDEDYENPIVARMEAMILEKTGESAVADSRRTSSTKPESVVSSASQVRSVPVDPTYAQVDDVTSSAPVSTSTSTSHVTSVKRELKHPVTGERLDTVDGSGHPPLSATHSEDLGPTGNQVTSEAFQFLDNYIGSDEEGVDSPPMSPGPRRDSRY